MVTPNPGSSNATSPTKPKKVWKPKPPAEGGVPSLFAHATLSKPLKVNTAITSTVRRRTSKTEPNNVAPASSSSAAASTPVKKESSSSPPAVGGVKPAAPKSKFVQKRPSTATPVITAAKAPSTTSIKVAAAKVPPPSDKQRYSSDKPKRKSSTDNATLVIGGCTTVAGTPQSWPKPHKVPSDEKPKIVPKPKPHKKKVEEEPQLHKNIDDLIPEMYRKKSAKQLEQEQQEEIQLMRKIMWELRRAEMEKEEKALQYQPIRNDVDATLRALANAKKQSDMADDHSSLDESTKPSAYSEHIRSKLEFFNSHHSVSMSNDSSDSDSSSVSSWDSDASDGLFRG